MMVLGAIKVFYEDIFLIFFLNKFLNQFREIFCYRINKSNLIPIPTPVYCLRGEI